MESYRIEWRRSTKKDLRKIPPQDVARIVDRVNALAEEPIPDGAKKLSGSENAFRIRVGDYRILYEIYGNLLIIEVIKIGHRRDVYRG